MLRDRRSLTILIGMPVMMMLLYGFALSNEVKNTPYVVLDQTHDEVARRLTQRLSESPYFRFVGTIASEAELAPTFRQGRATLAFLLPPDLARDAQHEGRATVRIVADAADTNSANIALSYAAAVVAQTERELWPASSSPQTPRLQVNTRMLYNPQLRSSYNFVPGVMTLILMLLGAMMTSVSIVREKENGTMEVLLVSPMNPLLVNTSKALPYMFLCMFDVLIILALSYGLLGLPLTPHIGLLLAECFLYILTTLSIGLFISNRVATQQVAMFISLVGLLMPSLVFSGFMFPIDNMPLPMQIISHLVPTRWFYTIISSVMIKGLGLREVLWPSAILIGMTIVAMWGSMRSFKTRLE